MRTAPFTLSGVTLCLSILLDVLMIPLLLIALPWLLFKIVIEGRGFGSLRDLGVARGRLCKIEEA